MTQSSHIMIWHNFSPCDFNNAQIFCKIVQFWIKSIELGGSGGALASPIFYRSVNPFPTRVTDSTHPFLLATPNFSTFGIIHKWCPIFLSHFWPPPSIQFLPSIIRFFGVILDPAPPLKSDIIYVRSLSASLEFWTRKLSVVFFKFKRFSRILGTDRKLLRAKSSSSFCWPSPGSRTVPLRPGTSGNGFVGFPVASLVPLIMSS